MRIYKYKAEIYVPDTENQQNYRLKGLVQCYEDDTEKAEYLILKWLSEKYHVSESNISLRVKQIPIIDL